MYLEPTTRRRSPISVKVHDQFRLTICDFGSHRIQVYKKEAYELAGNRIALPRSFELSRPGPAPSVKMSPAPGAVGLGSAGVPLLQSSGPMR